MKDKFFRSIQQAIQANNLSFFSEYSSEQIALNYHSKSLDTPLHLACRHGRKEILQYLIDIHKMDIEVSNRDGKRPLHEAAQYSHEECASFLVSRNASVDAIKRGDWTSLMLACTQSSVALVQVLLQAGADPCLVNKDGWNSFHIACREGHLMIVACLLETKPDVWNVKSKNLRTPLHTAALHGKKDIVLYLIEKCYYCTDEKDSCGVTPLMDALRAGHTETAEVLIQYHKEEDKVGRQAIHITAQSGMLTALDYVITKGIPVNAKSSRNLETPLHLAAMEGHVEVGERLLKLGVDMNAIDHKGRSALHYASCGHHSRFVDLLLSVGAQCFPDCNGKWPQQLATKQSVKMIFDKELSELKA